MFCGKKIINIEREISAINLTLRSIGIQIIDMKKDFDRHVPYSALNECYACRKSLLCYKGICKDCHLSEINEIFKQIESKEQVARQYIKGS